MISLVVPTRNRAHTLKRVLGSFYAQEPVTELIFVCDAGEDDSEHVISEWSARHAAKRTLFLRTTERRGAAFCRNWGVEHASNAFILFCDDDEFLDAEYASVCLQKLASLEAGAVSGRRVYMRDGDTPESALLRFGDGVRDCAPFRKLICEYVNAARFTADIALPITNAVILTRKELLLRMPYDPFYSRGNGYREESDFQMNLYVNGYDVVVTNACHSIHLPPSQVASGGQRTSRMRRLYWSVFYTRYFFGKYYARYAKRVGLRAPRWAALGAFAAFAAYRETVRPLLYRMAYWAMARKAGVQSGAVPSRRSA